MAEYDDILSVLRANKDKLVEMLKGSEAEIANIPRYNLAGISTYKTINMTNTVDHLIRDFSKERKISQKEIIEIAVVEFLKQYGYADQVKTVLHV